VAKELKLNTSLEITGFFIYQLEIFFDNKEKKEERTLK
jgi:hypothetical protein